MKKVFVSFWLLVTVSLTAIVFNSCDDDDKGGNSSSLLVGTWVQTENFFQVEDGSSTPEIDIFDVADAYAVFIFNANGTFTRMDEDGDMDEGTWELKNNTLTFFMDGAEVASAKTSITSTTLVLESTGTSLHCTNEDCVTYPTTIKQTFTKL